MTRSETVELFRNGVVGWSAYRRRYPRFKPDLSGVTFTGFDLNGYDLSGADLTHTDFTDTELRGANLDGAKFEYNDLRYINFSGTSAVGANFRSVYLAGANFRGAALNGANFAEADLEGADFRQAILYQTIFDFTWLRGTNFSESKMSGTVFNNVLLDRAINLTLVEHSGPSNIGVSTLYLSGGNIPESFMRDAGIPQGLITQLPSLIGAQEGIQFYSCFISYSHKDEAFAERLFSKLRDKKLRVWYAPEEMKGGQKIHEQIETAIRLHEKLLLVLSEASLKSEWVKTEIRNARRQERKAGKRKLFPVRLVNFETIRDWSEFDADSGKDLGVELREYFIPDFSEWKDHDKFEAAFARLLRDLKAEAVLPVAAP